MDKLEVAKQSLQLWWKKNRENAERRIANAQVEVQVAKEALDSYNLRVLTLPDPEKIPEVARLLEKFCNKYPELYLYNRYSPHSSPLSQGGVSGIEQNIRYSIKRVVEDREYRESQVRRCEQIAEELQESLDARNETPEDHQHLVLMNLFEYLRINEHSDYLIIRTPGIVMKWNPDSSTQWNYYMGHARIRIPASGSSDFHIQCHDDGYNTREDDDCYWHPHVSSDGYLCMGELERAMHQMWDDGDVVGLAVSVWQILCNYNPDSPYRNIMDWGWDPLTIRRGEAEYPDVKFVDERQENEEEEEEEEGDEFV